MSESTPTPADVAPKADDAPAPNGGGEVRLPEDHPLVKTLAAQKDEIKTLREKARRVDEVEASLTEANAAVGAVPVKVAEALRTHLVSVHEIEPDDAELFLTAQDPDLLLKQVSRLVGQSQAKKHVVPREGSNPRPKSSGSSWASVLDEINKK